VIDGVWVLVAEGVNDGVNVTVGVLVLVGVNVREGVRERVSVADGVIVKEGVSVKVGVNVVVGVGVGVLVTVPVMTNGVALMVGLGSVPVRVMEGVRDGVTVRVNCSGLGRSDTATKPRQ
jgi:hypothetical protein